jgi:lipoyl synthase
MKTMEQQSMSKCLPEQIRVSSGTATVLGLLSGKLDAAPTTAYLMTYKTGKCMANCGFCPQARSSKGKTELLSRVSWPTFPTEKMLPAIVESVKNGKIRRVCIQALNYPGVFPHLEALVKELKGQVSVPVSVSCQPLNSGNIQLLADAGADRIGIALDAATEKIFCEVKGENAGCMYDWENQFSLLQEAVEIFGEGNVSTHVIVGLGESEKEAACIIQKCVDMGVLPALFAFTPVRGTALEVSLPPAVESYRRIQLTRHLIVNGTVNFGDLKFDEEGKVTGFGADQAVLKALVEGGKPFLTSGCQNCNRPFYNEKPSGPIYNYPRKITLKEIEEIEKQLKLLF